jgi:hypothetical protein
MQEFCADAYADADSIRIAVASANCHPHQGSDTGSDRGNQGPDCHH